MQDVVSVKAVGGTRLRIRFDDGVEGELDVGRFLKFTGTLAPLRDPEYFARVFVHPEFGSVSWPDAIDLDTLVLYSKVTGRSIRSLLNPVPRPRTATRAKARSKRRRTASAR